ncbi:GTP pyrophosphokinase family protein [Ahrensia sp. 13_GOM-1096m]|uniref:GTP pyrophosphokinase n=1 Tax=Ahrensia sp. 13_GOM-1096m TaxID=1380380 RepID=UPI000478A837|nr:hypothetical protein [Ahrensia sp. 13_GOM-1096m]
MDFDNYYVENEQKFNALGDAVESLIRNIARQRAIEFVSIENRIKTRDSCALKIKTKSYKDPAREMQDIVGVRIVVHFIDNLQVFIELIKETFQIDEKNSYEENGGLGTDRVGYRSSHFVCTFDPKRCELEEYSGFRKIQFEIQIRTILQHAWAELAHDRSYKLDGGLPKKIRREVNLYAGMLEIADRNFSKIITDIEEYKKKITTQPIQKQEIDSFTLKKFLNEAAIKFNIDLVEEAAKVDEKLAEEVRDFGIKDISELANIFDEIALEAMSEETTTNYYGFLRSILTWYDLPRYMQRAHNGNWNVIDKRYLKKLELKYPDALKIFSDHSVELEEELEPFWESDIE